MKYIDFDLFGDIMLLTLVIGTSIYFFRISKIIAYLGVISFIIKVMGMKYKNTGDKKEAQT